MKRAFGASQSDTRAFKKARTSVKAKPKYNFGNNFKLPTTSLGKSKAPFPLRKRVTFIYDAFAARAPASNGDVVLVSPNDMFDFDQSNYLGNKQPLYFDTLLSATGPYKQFTAIKWKLTWTIANTSSVPIVVFFTPTSPTTTDIDSAIEVTDYPGVQKVLMGQAGSSNSVITRVVRGAPTDYSGCLIDPSTSVGSHATSPGQKLYSGLYVTSADATTTITYSILLKAEIVCDLNYMDAIVS